MLLVEVAKKVLQAHFCRLLATGTSTKNCAIHAFTSNLCWIVMDYELSQLVRLPANRHWPAIWLILDRASFSPCPTLRSWTLCPPSSGPHQRLLVRLRRAIERQLAIMVKATTTTAHHQAAVASPPLLPIPHRKYEAISPLMPR